MVGAVGRPVAVAVAVLLVLGGAGGVAAAAGLPDAAPATTGDRPGSGASAPAIGGASSPVAAAPTGASWWVAAEQRPTLARSPGAEAALTGVPFDPRVTGAPPTDATVTRIRLQADGTAVWTVEIRTLLTNDTDLAAYEAFQVRFRNDTERYLGSFRDRMTRLVDRAANVTDREMAARNFTARTSIDRAPRRWGVVTYRFRWSGFARVGDEELAVGDVFQSGYYLAESDSLVIEAPQGYVVDEAVPEPSTSGELTVRWSGPTDFGDGRPSVRVSLPSTPTPAPTGTPTDGDGNEAGAGADGGDDGSGSGGSPILPAVVLGIVLLVGGVGTYMVVGRTRGPGSGSGSGGQEGSDGAAVADGEGPAAGVDAGAGAAADAGTGESDTGEGDGPAPVPDEELLTDEERVVGLLERNGGRMRQADIADELDWSAPKTSRVLSSMADDGEIRKLRLGNENVIDLPDED